MLQKAYYGLGSNERCIHLSLFVVSFILRVLQVMLVSITGKMERFKMVRKSWRE